MRVASIAFTDYDSDPRVRRMNEALAARGDDVTAIVLREPGQQRDRDMHGVHVIGLGSPRYQGSDIRAYLKQYLRFGWKAMKVLTKLHRADPFDLVHVNNMPDFLVFAALPARFLGAKVILDLHDPMPELFEAKMDGRSRRIVTRGITLVERLSVASAHKAISVQSLHLDTFVSHGNPRSKFVVVQNAADPRLFPVGAALDQGSNGRKRIVYHGTMAPRLGVDSLLLAVASVREELGDFEVLLIGDGDDSDRLESIITTHNLGDVVRFDRGFIPVDELLPELVSASIGVVPAGRDSFTSTMLPSKLLEYVSLGIPVVCADLPAVRRYFRPDELALFSPGDVYALGQALVRLANDGEGRRLQATRAMRFLDEHSWAIESERYLTLVDELVAS